MCFGGVIAVVQADADDFSRPRDRRRQADRIPVKNRTGGRMRHPAPGSPQCVLSAGNHSQQIGKSGPPKAHYAAVQKGAGLGGFFPAYWSAFYGKCNESQPKNSPREL